MVHKIVTGFGLFFYIIGVLGYIFGKEKNEYNSITKLVATLFVSSMTYSMFYAFLN